MIKISYYNSDRLIFWKILKRDCVNFFSKRKLEKSILKKILRVCNFLWAARSRLIDVGGDSVTK